jgi:hypothetical protein
LLALHAKSAPADDRRPQDAGVGAIMTEATGQLRSSWALYMPGFLVRCGLVHMGVLAS